MVVNTILSKAGPCISKDLPPTLKEYLEIMNRYRFLFIFLQI